MMLKRNACNPCVIGSVFATGRERIYAILEGSSVDSLPLMPITMMFAADQIGVPYFTEEEYPFVRADLAEQEKL